MNNLSLFLYVADVVSGFSVVLGMLAFASVIGGVLFYGPVASDAYEKEEKDLWRSRGAKLFFFGFTIMFICALIPSKTTMYAIAASELGEEVLSTPEMGKARKALNNWLDAQLAESEEEE